MADVVADAGFRLSSGDRVLVRVLSGVVADDQRTADTRFYSVGGGGYVGPHGGSVAAPQIRSVTDKGQTIWITDDSGRDHSIGFKNVSIPIRLGQRITALYCQFEGAGVERCEYLVNHSSQLGYCLAREFTPIIDFASRYRKGPLMALMLCTLFLGAMLIWLKPFQPASDDDYRSTSVISSCSRLPPRDAKKPARVQEQLARRYAECERLLQQASEVRKAAWHAWWVPAACATVWIWLVVVNSNRRTAFGGRLYAEYLAALEGCLAASRASAQAKPL